MKKLNRKSASLQPPAQPAPAPYFHHSFKFFRSPPPNYVFLASLLLDLDKKPLCEEVEYDLRLFTCNFLSRPWLVLSCLCSFSELFSFFSSDMSSIDDSVTIIYQFQNPFRLWAHKGLGNRKCSIGLNGDLWNKIMFED